MKLKALLLALFVAGIGASAALAEKGPKPKHRTGTQTTTSTTEHGKRDHRKTDACKPNVSLVLKGTFVSAGADSFVMTVAKANKHARALAGKDATVKVDSETRFRRQGHAKLADLRKGDRVMVQVRACKKASESVVLLARRVDARPAKSKDGTGTTGGTTTGGTTTGGTTGGTTTGGTTGGTTTGGTTTGGTTGGTSTGTTGSTL